VIKLRLKIGWSHKKGLTGKIKSGKYSRVKGIDVNIKTITSKETAA
jgi:hypothetical protein